MSNRVKIWADFNASSDLGLRLNCIGTIEDLKKQNVELEEGLELLLWDEDFDDNDNRDNLVVKANARYNPKLNLWEAEFDWHKIRHESEIKNDE